MAMGLAVAGDPKYLQSLIWVGFLLPRHFAAGYRSPLHGLSQPQAQDPSRSYQAIQPAPRPAARRQGVEEAPLIGRIETSEQPRR
ncbi:hypothetical protein GQ55_2G459300 [Panicum hallii var. hallii]|uniref:Uncharacterized protein n=2 Tax=Panicum hallii TaxID=206008 RepID=A0A2T7EZI9_9POAL|nr:hypothetical protein PAHAL_2G472200 [Panicum hallii]PUZ73250.1 hypothetical protein GQ55_2G459300 [Panicum hallii var. hallii]